MVILLPEYENSRLLTPREPTLWLSWATNERPGWSQFESTAGNESSPHRLVLTLGELFVQLSCV